MTQTALLDPTEPHADAVEPAEPAEIAETAGGSPAVVIVAAEPARAEPEPKTPAVAEPKKPRAKSTGPKSSEPKSSEPKNPELETVGGPNGFESLGLDPRLVAEVAGLGYDEPSPIQRESIPHLLAGRDLIGQAGTGTGKTAAFALPMLQRLASPERAARGEPAALILVPTRELAIQVAAAVTRYGRTLKTTVLAVYGGQGFDEQLRALRRGVDVVVATPGRAHDHLRRGTLKLGRISVVVLDEADQMLDMGFAEDLEALLSQTPAARQTMLFSATMPPHITGIAERHLKDPVRLNVAPKKVVPGTAPQVRQTAYLVHGAYRLASLRRILDTETPSSAIVFCRTRNQVDEVHEALTGSGYRPEALHGGISQDQRDRVMRKFRAETSSLLVATDVAARGLDVGHLSHVINYDVPIDTETYVHRIGRVGRAGREGVALTLVEPREQRRLRDIERFTRQPIEIRPVPSVADLEEKRLDRARDGLRAHLLAGGLDRFKAIIEPLLGEHEPLDIALAALKLAGVAAEEAADEIPPPSQRERPRGDRREYRNEFRGDGRGDPRGDRGRRGGQGRMSKLFIGAGWASGISPRDLVGAIAGETGIPGKDVGSIDIAERFSIVEVPESVADVVIEALQSTRIKGRRVIVRRDRRTGE